MEKATEYRDHAKACRRLASLMAEPENRQQLLHMAEGWERLAHERERLVRVVEATEGNLGRWRG